MTKFITGTFRSVALIIAASSFVALNTNAQDVDKFYRIDKSTLEILVSSESITYPHPMLIVSQDDGMAMSWETTTNGKTFMPAQSVIIKDGYAETETGNKYLHFNIEYIGKSSDSKGLKFKIVKLPSYNYLGTIGDKFYFDGKDAKTEYTLFFDDSDESRLQIQSGYYKNSIYQSIVYTGNENNRGFELVDDNSKGLSLYRIDYIGMELAETPIDANGISITLNPHKDLGMTELYINYILNKGEDVSMSDLLHSEHYQNVSWKGYKSGPLNISLPNYNNEATTLWAIATIKHTNETPIVPFGPVFHSTYSDVSTGITSTEITADDATPIYYTIQGVRVSNPSAPGIYLCRRGSNVSKILIR